MPRFVPDPARVTLGFTTQVRVAFRFLEEQFGFHITRVEEPTFVRYEMLPRFVNVYHTRGGYRVGAEIGRMILFEEKRVGDSVTLFEVVSAAGNAVVAKALDSPAETPSAVAAGVENVAQLVREYGTEFLLGDERAFARIDEFRDAAMQRAAAEGARIWEMRKAAHKAWQDGDYAEAVHLLRILSQYPGMTDEEKRMLEIGSMSAD